MLSDPPKLVANGCVVGYFSRPRFDLTFGRVYDTDESQNLALLCSLLPYGIKLGVKLWKTRDELVACGNTLEGRRDQGMLSALTRKSRWKGRARWYAIRSSACVQRRSH